MTDNEGNQTMTNITEAIETLSKGSIASDSEVRKAEIIANLRGVLNAFSAVVDELENTPTTEALRAARIFAILADGSYDLYEVTTDVAVVLAEGVLAGLISAQLDHESVDEPAEA